MKYIKLLTLTLGLMIGLAHKSFATGYAVNWLTENTPVELASEHSGTTLVSNMSENTLYCFEIKSSNIQNIEITSNTIHRKASSDNKLFVVVAGSINDGGYIYIVGEETNKNGNTITLKGKKSVPMNDDIQRELAITYLFAQQGIIGTVNGENIKNVVTNEIKKITNKINIKKEINNLKNFFK